MNAFSELKILGIKSKWRSQFGETFAVSRDLNGEWFACSKNGFHLESERAVLSLSNSPALSKELKNYETKDADLRKNGGRVFIGRNGIFRKK